MRGGTDLTNALNQTVIPYRGEPDRGRSSDACWSDALGDEQGLGNSTLVSVLDVVGRGLTGRALWSDLCGWMDMGMTPGRLRRSA